MKVRDSLLEVSGEIVGFYEREFYCFSNFSSFAVDWNQRFWQTAEHAYQAAHFFGTDPALVNKIHDARSAHDAYKLAKANSNKVSEHWDSIKINMMEDIVRCKLEQNPYVMLKLIQTGEKLIVEDSPKDSFWGWGSDRKGKNELGKIWMRLREEFVG
jgi:ribA/ribD-fused uncharacterized protein